VWSALEYTMKHQRLNEAECCYRRAQTRDWLDALALQGRFQEWLDMTGIGLRATEIARELTPEERQAKIEAQEEKTRQKSLANARAEALLRSVLTAKQLRELDSRGHFHVKVGDRRFRITRGRSHNVKEVDKQSRVLRTFCAHPIERVPDADTMLAQKLVLETRPDDFFGLANVMQVQRRRRSIPVEHPLPVVINGAEVPANDERAA
jgi:hypothetical protein